MSNTTIEPTVITGEQLIREVRKLAEEQPEATGKHPNGKSCAYFVDGKPSCGIGHALNRLGVQVLPSSLEVGFQEFREQVLARLGGVFADLAGNEFELRVSATEMKRLTSFQDGQDSGTEWGRAVDDLGAAYA